jgi:hypothetical protein
MAKKTLVSGAGYLVIDHRDSPGLTPEDVAHVPGALVAPGGEVLERDVLQCAHCQRSVVLHPLRTRPRSYCAKCDHYICDDPICNRECRPFAHVLDRAASIAEKFAGQPDHPDAQPDIVLTDR